MTPETRARLEQKLSEAIAWLGGVSLSRRGRSTDQLDRRAALDVIAEVRNAIRDGCQRCGAAHLYDTSVPSADWNEVIRSGGYPDFLCLSCIVQVFAKAGRGFTARLWSDDFAGIDIEIVISAGSGSQGERITGQGALVPLPDSAAAVRDQK